MDTSYTRDMSMFDGLAASAERLRQAAGAGRLTAAVLERATGARVMQSWTLAPVPADPVAHLRAAHDRARPYLVRLAEHDPALEVMGQTGRFAYTPRKILRRVLDHGLDHLDQIEQWAAWRAVGRPPVPADGWVGSVVTLDEDRQRISPGDHEAWLWRIDQVVERLTQRAAALTPEQLDWQPPEAVAWPLRRIVHHVARVEPLYAVSLEEALAGDAESRYREATWRLLACLEALAGGPAPHTALVHPNGEIYSVERAVREVLALEETLIGSAT